MANTTAKNRLEEENWRGESDLHTLLEAKRIEADPERMKAVRKAAKKRKESLVKDLQSLPEVIEGEGKAEMED